MPWSVSLSIISIIDTYLHSAYPCLSINILSRSAAITGLGYLEAMLQTSPGFGSLRRYLLATLQPVYRRLGLEEVPVLSTVSRRSEKVSTEAGYSAQVAGESYLDQRLRVVVAELVCRLGDQECAQHSRGLLADWQTQQVDIRLSIYLSIYVTGLSCPEVPLSK